MDTAHGMVNADEVLPCRRGKLKSDIKPFVLDDTPDVLTIGGRSVNEGYGFYWSPYSKVPYFELPGFEKHGRKCQLVSINDVPYLVDGRNTRVAKKGNPVMPSGKKDQPMLGGLKKEKQSTTAVATPVSAH